jgi:hypothetical protein
MMNMSSMGGGSSMVVQSSSFSMNGQEVQVSTRLMWRGTSVGSTAARCFQRSATANTTATSTSLLTAAYLRAEFEHDSKDGPRRRCRNPITTPRQSWPRAHYNGAAARRARAESGEDLQ